MARSRSSSSGAMPYACSGAGNARVRTSSAYSRTPRTISDFDVRVALDELRLEAVVDAQQVVQDEHLAVRAAARADPDDRDLHVRHDRVGHLGRDGLEDDREAARLLERERVVEHRAWRARPCGPERGSRRARSRSAG